MADASIRGLDDQVRERLRVRAAKHLIDVLHATFAELGGVELRLPARTTPTRAADFADRQR